MRSNIHENPQEAIRSMAPAPLVDSAVELECMKKQLIVGAAIGDCVHVAGVVNFLNLAEQLGYETPLWLGC